MDINDAGFTPLQIEALASSLRITWSTGRVTEHSYPLLRRSCRCASCVEETTGRPLLDPATVSEDIEPTAINRVGNYAIQITWSDGHGTGIYSYRHLRSLESDIAPGT